MRLLEVKNLSLRYLSQKTYLFKNINFSVDSGEILKIVGKNGSGKSSLCLSLAGLSASADLAYEGEILLGEKDITQLSRKEICAQLSLVFQNSYDTIFLPTVMDEMAFGLENLCVDATEINHRIDEAMALLGIEELKHKSIKQLSAGQLQKVSIACSVAFKPRILILDEVSSALDNESVSKLGSLLKGLKSQGTAIVLVDHNGFCDELVTKTVELIR